MLTIPNYLAIIERGDYMSSLLTNLFVNENFTGSEGASVMTAIRSGTYNYETDYEYQKKENDYLKYLQSLLAKQKAGERVDISPVRRRLQRAGILDDSGELAEIYKTGKR